MKKQHLSQVPSKAAQTATAPLQAAAPAPQAVVDPPAAVQQAAAVPHFPVPSPIALQQRPRFVVAGSGSVHLIMGAMFAGKTSELLRRVREEQGKGLNVLLLKSCKDTRYTAAHISSHSGERLPCKEANDESQFFSDLTEFVTTAADVDGKHVIVAGLDGDFQRRKFGQLLDLVPMAEGVTKLHGLCMCGRASAFSLRMAASDNQELVG
eukprot:CAMPEP_0202364696 /NCGR_PEP_ID=MMETSP1126-20121109/16007_1 /ASSEMBLY_ACC=CAM_ASM_000457 /TAXON_ID=3047 /ORGANISM="Dunaliella tertiolecta, Strain CCMP1320" /LENGTH=208 /DNA_ID=CAMNT_0048959403 /DNA_START=162 /DNA_END=786 /DNA_ORIENTATION=+